MSEEKEMRAEGVGPALGGAGSPCPEIKVPGKTWKVGWPTQSAKIHHELLVAAHAEEELEARRGIYSREKFARKERELEEGLLAGEHHVGGAYWNRLVDGPDWNVVLLASLLKEHHPEATVADARALWAGEPRKVRVALAYVIPPFATALVNAAPVPQEEKAAKALAMAALFRALCEPPPDPNPDETGTPTDSPAAPSV